MSLNEICAARWAALNEIAFSARGYGSGSGTGGHSPVLTRTESGWTLENGDQGAPLALSAEEVEALHLPDTAPGAVWEAPFDPPCGLPRGSLIQTISADRVPVEDVVEGESLDESAREGVVIGAPARVHDLSAPRYAPPAPPTRSVWRFRYA